MIKKMGGDRAEWSYPVLSNGNDIAVTDKEKAESLVNTFVKICTSNNCLKREEEAERRRRRSFQLGYGLSKWNNHSGSNRVRIIKYTCCRIWNTSGKCCKSFIFCYDTWYLCKYANGYGKISVDGSLWERAREHIIKKIQDGIKLKCGPEMGIYILSGKNKSYVLAELDVQ